MIDYARLDGVLDEGYPIIKYDGVVYKVGLAKQCDLIMINKYQFKIQKLNNEYSKVSSKGLHDEKSFDKLDSLYRSLMETVKEMFLFILNLNGKKVFDNDFVNTIPFEIIKNECDNYVKYVKDKLKN